MQRLFACSARVLPPRVGSWWALQRQTLARHTGLLLKQFGPPLWPLGHQWGAVPVSLVDWGEQEVSVGAELAADRLALALGPRTVRSNRLPVAREIRSAGSRAPHAVCARLHTVCGHCIQSAPIAVGWQSASAAHSPRALQTVCGRDAS